MLFYKKKKRIKLLLERVMTSVFETMNQLIFVCFIRILDETCWKINGSNESFLLMFTMNSMDIRHSYEIGYLKVSSLQSTDQNFNYGGG